MLQDMEGHDVRMLSNASPRPDDYILSFSGNSGDQVLLDFRSATPALPTYQAVQRLFPAIARQLEYIVTVDDHSFFLAPDTDEIPLAPGYRLHSTHIFRSLQPEWMAYWGAVANQLHRWYANRRYCGRCAQPLRKSDTERALVCDACHLTEYPKLSPAIIVGITDGDRLLLTKYASGQYRRYALIAGFVEAGETLAATAKREAMEEVGLRIKNLRYFDCQPWPFSDSLLMGFFADLDGDAAPTPDGVEVAVAQWVDRASMPPGQPMSLTGTMMEAFRTGLV